MSLLPQYRRDMKPKSDIDEQEESESLPLWFDAHRDDNLDDLDEPAPACPPRFSAELEEGSKCEQRNVTYTFVPRRSIEAEQEDILGVLGKTKKDTIANVQKGLPALAGFPASRIEFYSQFTGEVDWADDPRTTGWCKVMDEAWPRFKQNSPRAPRVQIADLPGDAKRRKKHQAIQQFWKEGPAIILGILLLMVVWTFLGYVLHDGEKCENLGGEN
ncbi:hypothetical protein IAT40_006709 [Kwoniella sp. CBS 6097]